MLSKDVNSWCNGNICNLENYLSNCASWQLLKVDKANICLTYRYISPLCFAGNVGATTERCICFRSKNDLDTNNVVFKTFLLLAGMSKSCETESHVAVCNGSPSPWKGSKERAHTTERSRKKCSRINGMPKDIEAYMATLVRGPTSTPAFAVWSSEDTTGSTSRSRIIPPFLNVPKSLDIASYWYISVGPSHLTRGLPVCALNPFETQRVLKNSLWRFEHEIEPSLLLFFRQTRQLIAMLLQNKSQPQR